MPSIASIQSPPRRRAPFKPKVRGDLKQALGSVDAFLGVAPAVPRTVAWLRDRTLASMGNVTARDISLFETLVAMTATGEETDATIHAARLCSVKSALTVLSAGGHDAQPRELVAALKRLFDDKPKALRRKDTFYFHIPSWAVSGLLPGGRYAHLDLAVLSRFRRRSSPFLYREILAHIAAERIRYEPSSPPFVMNYATADLAAALGMPAPAPGSTLHAGQFRLRYLDPAIAEIGEHVRSFEIVSVSTELQARAVASVAITVRLCPPERLETVPTRLLEAETFSTIVKRRDAPPYAVKAATIVRLGSSLPSARLRNRKTGRAAPLLQSEMHVCYDLWLAALHEALTGEAITPGYETGAYRGQRLLDAIARDGADLTFWAFSHAEAAAPDIGPAIAERYRFKQEIEKARKLRLKAFTAAAAQERRRTLREARADGMVPPKPAKKRVTVPSKHAVPMPSDVPAMPMPPAIVDLTSPAARAEGVRLYREWQPAFEFPFAKAVLVAARVKEAFAAGEYPILAQAGDAYLEAIARLDNITRDFVPGLTVRKQDENASHYVAMIAMSWPTRVSNGRSVNPAAEVAADRALVNRDVKRDREADRVAKAQAEARKGAPPPRPTDGFRDGYVPKRAS